MKTIIYLFLYSIAICIATFGQTQDSSRIFDEKELVEIAEKVSKIIFAQDNLKWAKENISRYAKEKIAKDLHKDLVINKLQYIGYPNSQLRIIVHLNQELNPLKNKLILFHCVQGDVIIPSDSTKEEETRLTLSHPPSFYLAVDYIGRFYILDIENEFSELIYNYFDRPLNNSKIETIIRFYLNTVHMFSYNSQKILDINTKYINEEYQVSVKYLNEMNNKKETLQLRINDVGQIECIE